MRLTWERKNFDELMASEVGYPTLLWFLSGTCACTYPEIDLHTHARKPNRRYGISKSYSWATDWQYNLSEDLPTVRVRVRVRVRVYVRVKK
jgi:hypothetical protein